MRRRHRLPIVAILAAALSLAAAGMWAPVAADSYAFDRQHTNISFSWDRFGVSRQVGRLLDFDGQLEFDPLAPEAAKLEVTMKAQSLATGIDALDRHLRSADFFDVGKHPQITFRSTAVKVTGPKTGEVTGDLTIMGVSRPVTLAVTWAFTGEHPWGGSNPSFVGKVLSAFAATARLQRSDWGLTRGTPLASDEIDIVINAEFVRR